MKRPIGVHLIGYFYIMGSVILLLSLSAKQTVKFNVRFGVPFLPETYVMIFVSLFSLVMAYGYLRMKRWGYWTMLLYSILFLLISLNQINQYHSQPFIGNAFFSMVVLIYTFMKRKEFFKTSVLSQELL